jgi:single-strand DNA-binding protein
VDCQAFGRQAENINKYMSKGRALFVEGRLTFNSWTAQDGTKRSRHKVTVENFQFLGAPGGRESGEGSPNVKEGEPRPSEERGERDGTHFANEGKKGPEGADDIPF